MPIIRQKKSLTSNAIKRKRKKCGVYLVKNGKKHKKKKMVISLIDVCFLWTKSK